MSKSNGKSRNDFRPLTIFHPGRTSQIVTDIVIYQPIALGTPAGSRPGGFPSKALWDTGASTTVITQNVIQALGLAQTGRLKILHAGGSNEAPTYLATVHLPNDVMATVTATGVQALSPDFDVLIGMDIITQGDFSVTNVNGQTCMTFRIPSIETIDYVDERNRNAGGEKCWCGSGRKLRDCHRTLP